MKCIFSCHTLSNQLVVGTLMRKKGYKFKTLQYNSIKVQHLQCVFGHFQVKVLRLPENLRTAVCHAFPALCPTVVQPFRPQAAPDIFPQEHARSTPTIYQMIQTRYQSHLSYLGTITESKPQ